jgi:hypothetical protein
MNWSSTERPRTGHGCGPLSIGCGGHHTRAVDRPSAYDVVHPTSRGAVVPFSYQAIEPLRPIRYNANREVAERVFARLDRHRLTMPYARWRDYAVGQIAAALDAAATSTRPTHNGGSNVITA